MKPTMSSPGTGVQQRENLIMQESMSSTITPESRWRFCWTGWEISSTLVSLGAAAERLAFSRSSRILPTALAEVMPP